MILKGSAPQGAPHRQKAQDSPQLTKHPQNPTQP